VLFALLSLPQIIKEIKAKKAIATNANVVPTNSDDAEEKAE